MDAYKNIFEKSKHYPSRYVNLVMQNVTQSYWSLLCFLPLCTKNSADIFYCFLMKGSAMNCERLRTEDSTRYCVHAATFQRLFCSYIHGPITEEVCNVNKVCGLSYSQCRRSYHKISCAVSSVL